MKKVEADYRYLLVPGTYIMVSAHYAGGDEKTALFITMPNGIIHTYTSEVEIDEAEIERIVKDYALAAGLPDEFEF